MRGKMLYLLVAILSLVFTGFAEEKKENLLLYTFDEANGRVLKIQIPSSYKKAFVDDRFDYLAEYIPANETLESWSEMITIIISNTQKPIKDIVSDALKNTQANNIPSLNKQSTSRLIGDEEGYYYIEKLGEKFIDAGIFIPIPRINESLHTHIFKSKNEGFVVQYAVRHSKEISKSDKNELFKKMEKFMFENCKITELQSIPNWKDQIVYLVKTEEEL